jgi:hypothetical protein
MAREDLPMELQRCGSVSLFMFSLSLSLVVLVVDDTRVYRFVELSPLFCNTTVVLIASFLLF